MRKVDEGARGLQQQRRPRAARAHRARLGAAAQRRAAHDPQRQQKGVRARGARGAKGQNRAHVGAGLQAQAEAARLALKGSRCGARGGASSVHAVAVARCAIVVAAAVTTALRHVPASGAGAPNPAGALCSAACGLSAPLTSLAPRSRPAERLRRLRGGGRGKRRGTGGRGTSAGAGAAHE